MESTVTLAAQHVLFHLHRVPRTQPMFVAVQGPQGSGKTHLTRSLVSTLSSPPHSLRFAVLSVDDLYFPHSHLRKLSADHPRNRLWNGRGQPGTHDVKLGTDILTRLRDINGEDAGDANAKITQVVLPIYDKSKNNGQGDRAAVGIPVNSPVDVVIMEGWCVGFYPLEQPELNERWEAVRAEAEATHGSIVQHAMEGIRREDIESVNIALRDYVKHWYGFFEVFVQVSADLISEHLVCLLESYINNTKIQSPVHVPYEYIFKWRLEQEHNMKAANGGIGMTEEQVISFVNRYIPGYIFFSNGVKQGASANAPPPWVGNGLCVTIGAEREVLRTEKF